jgi:acyl carrier protein phosphodiesterase
MNYLAHAWLSFNHPQILVGNMISDFIKGKKQFDYPSIIHKGIQLHRAIDNFTDSHEATQQLKLFFRPQYRLYAGAFADVVYDHFLATDEAEFLTEADLNRFATTTYEVLETNFTILPEAFQKMLPYMKEYNWLYNYRYKWGIEKSFAGLARRASYLPETAVAFELFNENYDAMRLIYQQFFPDIKRFAAHQMQQLLNT